MKPRVMRDLRPGTAIGAHRGFCETFNWMRRVCENLRGGLGVEVDRTDEDHPVIRMSGQSVRLQPFAVEWRDGYWCVYVPEGSVSLNGCRSLMTPESDGSDWYRVVGSSSADGSIKLYAHVKARVRISGGTLVAPGVTVTAHAGDVTDAACAGDVWTALLGTATTSGSAHSFVQAWSGSVDHLSVGADGLLELFWSLSAIGGDAFLPYVMEGDAPYLGDVEIDEASVQSTGDVFYTVDCTGTEPVPGLASSASSSEAVLSVKVYEMSAGRCVKDLRAALASQVFYP